MAQLTIEKAKKAKGGARKMLCWQEKLECVEKYVIQKFIKNAECVGFSGVCQCFNKLRELGGDGHAILHNLRTERLAGHAPRTINVDATDRFFSPRG